ncbi:hypothetical protein MRX96_021373 [Rhipicephalus microplus]
MQEDLPTSCDLSPLYEPSEHMTPFCNAHDGVSAASRKRSASACRHSTAAPVRHSPSGSAAHFDSSPPLPESSSPLPSASSVMAAPLVDDARAKAAHRRHTNSHACKLAIFIGCLILLSLVISQFLVTRQGNYAFSLTSKFGHVQGDQIFVHGGQPVIRYLGIPFAVPPVGKLRFQPSQVAEHLGAHLNNASPKRINFVERALLCPQDSTIAPSWMQIDLERTSEDCLYLSLWTPDTQCLFQGRDCGTRPVIVFFHGGDLSHGGNRVYDGAVLSSKADAVVAIPNYRLGLLGHSTGNESGLLFLGLGDQLTAIRWLRENVGFFGGNASRMVLAGHGAGAASVGHWILGTQPEIADVQRFVMISGSPYARYMKDADVTTKNMRILARRVQCESFDEVCSVEEILPCLRRFPSSVLGVDNVSVFLDNYQRELGTTNLDVVRREAYADVRYRCPMRRFAERMTSSDLSVHWFVFNAKPSFEESYLRSEDAGHYSTVRLLLTDLGNVRPTGEDIVVRDSIVRTLGSFVNTGRVPKILGGKEWPPYTSSTRAAVRIGRHGHVAVSMSGDPCRHARQHEKEPTAATTTEASTSRAAFVQPRVWVSPVSRANTAPLNQQPTPEPARPGAWFDDDAFVPMRRDHAVLIRDAAVKLSDVVPRVDRAASYDAKHADFEEA